MAERRPSAGSSALNEALKEFASNKYSLQNREQVAPRAQTIESARPSFRSALSNVMRDAFDPKNIRSINAEFDPTKADSADLLSSRQSERQMSALRGIA
jgi:hypothetical protein